MAIASRKNASQIAIHHCTLDSMPGQKIRHNLPQTAKPFIILIENQQKVIVRSKSLKAKTRQAALLKTP